MHVTHLVAHPPFREGTGTACYYNARALLDQGCGVTVYAPARGIRDCDRALEFYRFMPSWLAIENAFLTPDILSIDHTDFLHLHYPFIFGAELALAKAGAAKIPLVVTYHNDLIGGGIRRPVFYLYNRLIAPLILRNARKIAVTSFDHAESTIYAKTIFCERSQDLVEAGNGVDTNRFHPGIDPDNVRSRLALRPDETVVLFVSHLDRAHIRKGLFFLLEALTEVSDHSVKLLVVGDGEMRPRYEEKAKRLGISDRAIFAGRIPHNELPNYYAASDVVAIPSQPPESFGLALAEGMACGKPVIGCNIPGVRTVIQDGSTGFLVEPGDTKALTHCIELLAGDRELRRRMGECGLQRIAERYTWKHVGNRLLAMYETVISDPRTARN